MTETHDARNGDDWQPRRDADKGREPELVAGHSGRRMYSLNALAERISTAFVEEFGTDSADLREADTPTKRLKLLMGTVDYVMAVESVAMGSSEKAELINRVYSNLFGYGPLDKLFLDPRLTTIVLEGADKASVRYGHGELESLGPIFQTNDDLRRIIARLLADAGAELREDQPFIEAGFMAGDRPACINLVTPPLTFQLTADIRLHGPTVPSLDDLVTGGFMTTQARALLEAIMQSSHGLLIVAETESGKTTLLSVLARLLLNPEQVVAVERAGELQLPTAMHRLTARWPVGDQPGVTFGEQIGHALERKPACLILDEVRSDEPLTIAPLLEQPQAPRLIWSFRGAIFAKRLQSALSMLARRADFGQGETLVRSLYQRLPFVVTVNRVGGQLRLWSIAEWQFRHSPDYPTYTMLMQVSEGQLRLTEDRPALPLDLPDGFW
ncbi:MAG TPA: ATPase, T2SS/T4P/T4SS family [Aggregatilineales bacterium]|nr:ATPase, T2SS/T4P/T4SS family [Aggregatilineales bacterium]